MSFSETLEKSPEDPVERMIRVTGCLELHYQVQECVAEHQDWRKCQEQVKQFKACMAAFNEKQRQKQAVVQ